MTPPIATAPVPLFDTWLVTLYSPIGRPLSFAVLELVVLSCGLLGFLQARRCLRRDGEALPLFTWSTIFVYGLIMEISSYNFVDNFWHGHFTVMFYRHQLPLYILAVYPVLLYAPIATVRRLGLGRVAEPFVAGLMIVALDFPFDIIGAATGWWSWSDKDPNISFRWFGVPVTSFYWHFAFGGILCALTRGCSRWLVDPTRFTRRLVLTVPVALATIALGVLSFLPFHLLKGRGVPDGTIVGGLLAIGLVVLVVARKHRPRSSDLLLLAGPAVFYGAHLIIGAFLWASSDPRFGPTLGAIALVILCAAWVYSLAHRPREFATERR